ncbi:putative aldouronate transport system substrate-binding protein [Paenibacillus phyllosphaerae]|uniref:Putative aldouronate transport system substrate-binding protein n=1 Tax=Paenibacillus phyllosphaerae TaxID=274593 RepID=A0A7W5ASV9_9BACL|nr:extracellular solute-binding protein [Paenibacillus phyllosphaerae]MBB3108139.1 putative aldouronate transport system substrate-binding protein [Paenibacillus phyllosphaerae]
MKKNSMLLLVLLFTMLVASACGNNNNSNSPNASVSDSSNTSTSTSKPDNSKEVKLVGYLLGEAPKGMPDVLAALNEKLKKDINATLELNYIGWGDVAAKYPLILASGEDVDFVFAADWNFYVSEANKGAFMPLDLEKMKQLMPKYVAKQDPAAFTAATVNGEAYMIPTTTPDRKVSVAVIRKDIMEKVGLTEVKSIAELEPYFAEIKKNYPDMIPLNLDNQFDLPTPYQYLVNDKFNYPGAPIDSGDPLGQGITYDMADATGKMITMTDEPMLSAQKYAATIMKDWYDKGYVNKNPYSNKTRSKDNFCEGKSGVAFGNSIDIASVMSSCKAKGIDTYLIPTLGLDGKSGMSSWTANGISIPASSKNADRTMQALDLIMEDESYVNLVYFGIEGKNYSVTADGKLGLPEGVTSEDNTYPPDAAGFWFVDKDYFKPMAEWTDEYIQHHDQIPSYLTDYQYNGFTFNSEKVKTEVATLKNVSSQYASPIYVGIVKDVDSAFATLADKLKAAGIDKVKAEVEAQASAFLANKG